MGPSKTRVFLLLRHMGPLLLRIGAYDFVCGALLCSIMHTFRMGPSEHTRVLITCLHSWQLFCLWGVALLPNMYMFCIGHSNTRVCFSIFAYRCILFRLWGLALLTNMLIFCMDPQEDWQLPCCPYSLGNSNLSHMYVCLVKYQRKLHLQRFHTHILKSLVPHMDKHT